MRPKTSKRLLYIGQHAWSSPIKVGSHAIASQFLEKGWKVAYISAPISLFHFIKYKQPVFKERLRVMLAGGDKDFDGQLWHYVPFSLITPGNMVFNNMPWIFKNWQTLSLPNVLKKLIEQGFGEVDVILMDSIYQPFWFDAVKYKKCIVRFADLNEGFKGFSLGAQQSQNKNIHEADLVVTTSKSLAIEISRKFSKNVIPIPSGVDSEIFCRASPIPAEYQSMIGDIAVFVGTIDFWVDLDIIDYCARAMKDVNFVFIGPGVNQKIIKKFPSNVHFLGVRHHDEVPGYLKHATVGLIPFHLNKFRPLIDNINPLKIYEYLAAGIPVISTSLPEIEDMSEFVRFCRTKEHFLNALREVVTKSSPQKIFYKEAMGASWSERVKPLFSWLEAND